MAEITFFTVEAAQPFTEVRTGKAYQVGEAITDPAWLENEGARIRAYEARGKVKVKRRTEEIDDGGPLFRFDTASARKSRKKEGE